MGCQIKFGVYSSAEDREYSVRRERSCGKTECVGEYDMAEWKLHKAVSPAHVLQLHQYIVHHCSAAVCVCVCVCVCACVSQIPHAFYTPPSGKILMTFLTL